MRKTFVVLLLVAVAGCKSDLPTSSAIPLDRDRETPSNLVSRHLPWVVATRDSAAIASSIASNFTFRTAPPADDSTGAGLLFDRESVLDYLGGALAGHADDRGRTLETPSLVITEHGIFRDTEEDPTRPEDEVWYKADVRVDLVMAFRDPSADGGRSTDRYSASVFFWLGPDPENADLWVIERGEEMSFDD